RHGAGARGSGGADGDRLSEDAAGVAGSPYLPQRSRSRTFVWDAVAAPSWFRRLTMRPTKDSALRDLPYASRSCAISGRRSAMRSPCSDEGRIGRGWAAGRLAMAVSVARMAASRSLRLGLSALVSTTW